ncbi:MAG TPA: hypothetical protein VGC96_04495 [Candidatus Elarobacter sp.]
MIRTAAATAGLLAALALPAAAPAATSTSAQPQSYTFQTRLAGRYEAGEHQGTLTVTIAPDGIVRGYYRPLDGGIKTVTGGLTGKDIWLDIGDVHPLHVAGTLQNGVLRTVASIPGSDVYEFDSISVKTNR